MLSRFSDARVRPFLIQLLSAPEGSLRRAAALGLNRLLGSSSPGTLVPLLATLLESSDPDDREIAVWLLARINTPAAWEHLSRQRITERHRGVVDALRQVFRSPPR